MWHVLEDSQRAGARVYACFYNSKTSSTYQRSLCLSTHLKFKTSLKIYRRKHGSKDLQGERI
jgi:hypothetical protein